MTDETLQSEPKKLTTKELADKLDKVVDEVHELAKSGKEEDEWAKNAVDYQKMLHGYHPENYSEQGVYLLYDDAKRLCPEFFTQVIEPAIESANKKGDLYKTPKKPIVIVFDKSTNIIQYNNNHLFAFGIPEIRIHKDADEITALTSHEFWHGFQSIKLLLEQYDANFVEDLPDNNDRTFVPHSIVTNEYQDDRKESKIIEMDADRLNTSRALIATSLSSLINEKIRYNYNDIDNTHPNFRKRIKALIEETLGNEIFGMNGVWKEKPDAKGYHFQPSDIENSHPIVQKRVRENIKDYMRMKPQDGERITIDGRMIKNWGELEQKIEAKAEELMGKLDDYNSYSKFTIEKKDQWLSIFDKEVAEFKAQNPLEFTNPKDIPLGGWASGIKLERKFDINMPKGK